MKKTLLFLLLFISYNAISQKYNIPFRKGNLWGISDKNGTLLLEPKYDSINPNMSNFRWFIYKDNKVGILNDDNKEVLTPTYDSIFRKPVHSTYNEFIVYKDSHVGYADIDGNFILPIQYKIIKKADNDSYNRLPLKFFVQNETEINYKLINTNTTEILTNIQFFKETNNGLYIIQKENKVGVYNTVKNEWKIANTFDSIKYFSHKAFHEPKEAYENIKYYGIKNKVYYLFTRDFEQINTKINNFEDFFDPLNEENYDYIVEGTVSSSDFETKLVTGEAFVENNSYLSKDHYKTRLKIEIIKNKKKYSIITNNIGFNSKKTKQYDEIKLIKKTYNNTYDCNFALVKNKLKWQILDLVKNEVIPNIEFDSDEFHNSYKDALVLKNNSKIGICILNESNHEESDIIIINPVYDSLSTIEYINSLDDSYKFFKVYYFKKDGRVCPVGSNGINYYRD